MCTTRDTCDFYCDAFPSRDASQKKSEFLFYENV